jgi:hypothetical protein
MPARVPDAMPARNGMERVDKFFQKIASVLAADDVSDFERWRPRFERDKLHTKSSLRTASAARRRTRRASPKNSSLWHPGAATPPHFHAPVGESARRGRVTSSGVRASGWSVGDPATRGVQGVFCQLMPCILKSQRDLGSGLAEQACQSTRVLCRHHRIVVARHQQNRGSV